jgi:hypothetical protein
MVRSESDLNLPHYRRASKAIFIFSTTTVGDAVEACLSSKDQKLSFAITCQTNPGSEMGSTSIVFLTIFDTALPLQKTCQI